MHCLETMEILNAQHSGRAAAHASNAGDHAKASAILDAANLKPNKARRAFWAEFEEIAPYQPLVK